MTPEEEKAVGQVIDLLKPIVTKIESKPPSTKNHYGDYMVLLSHCEEPLEKKKIAACLILAGANKEGVTAALKLSL